MSDNHRARELVAGTMTKITVLLVMWLVDFPLELLAIIFTGGGYGSE